MVTQITLGNFSTQNGRNVITGGSTGFDTESLIKGLVEAKRQPAVRLETANKTIDSKTTALTDLNTLFKKFQSAVDLLRNPPGVDNATRNIFEYRTTSLVGLGGVTASNYVDATVKPGAAAQSYTIDSITQLAKATKQNTGDINVADAISASAVTANGSPTAGLFQAGTVNLRAVDGTAGGVAVTLTAGDSLQTVAAKFNQVSSQTGMQASILNVSSGVYKMVFTATKTGTTYGFDIGATAGSAGAGLVSDASGVFSQITATTVPGQTAQNAIFSVDGVTITRESNAVADVIENVTLNLKDSNLGTGSILISVKPDTTIVTNGINAFVDAYNEFRLFVSEQSELDENFQPKETAVLNNNSTFRAMINDVSAIVSSVVAGITGSNPSQLSGIGLKLENFDGDADNLATKNILTVDEEALSSALLSNFDGVRNLFEYSETSSNPNLVTFKRSNSLNGVTSFTINVDATNGVYTATYTDSAGGTQMVNLDATAIAGGGVSLKGQVGTVFEGAEFLYAVAGNATVTMNVTQGIADKFYNAIDTYTNTTNGTLLQELTDLVDTKTRNLEEVTTIDEKMTRYREQLIQQYATLESALTRANQLLQLLDAQSKAASE